MKKVLSALFAIIIVFLMGASVLAADVDSVQDKNYIVDQAGVFTEEEEKELSLVLYNTSFDRKMDIVVVTVDDDQLQGKSLMDYADDYYDYNGYSKNGALLLMRFVDGEYAGRGNSWISTSGKAINAISDNDIQSIGSTITPYLLSGEYYTAIQKYADKTNSIIKENTAIDFKNMAIWGIIVGIIAAIIVSSILKGQLKSVKQATDASNYIVDGSIAVLGSYDHFLYSTVTSVKKETSSSSGGSSTHTSSSGNTHGGGGF